MNTYETTHNITDTHIISPNISFQAPLSINSNKVNTEDHRQASLKFSCTWKSKKMYIIPRTAGNSPARDRSQ